MEYKLKKTLILILQWFLHWGVLGVRFTMSPSRAWYKNARISITNGLWFGDTAILKSRIIDIRPAFVCANANLIPVHTVKEKKIKEKSILMQQHQSVKLILTSWSFTERQINGLMSLSTLLLSKSIWIENLWVWIILRIPIELQTYY